MIIKFCGWFYCKKVGKEYFKEKIEEMKFFSIIFEDC